MFVTVVEEVVLLSWLWAESGLIIQGEYGGRISQPNIQVTFKERRVQPGKKKVTRTAGLVPGTELEGRLHLDSKVNLVQSTASHLAQIETWLTGALWTLERWQARVL